ncbi:hypothetical protein PLICRDRAFT_174448 [Plicaturopsis crispa FD-325 SS-3]|nr:hypothetical protein PLICRDRAFT_174448 [Plicaturopsis crispa FD-325 SS-3]
MSSFGVGVALIDISIFGDFAVFNESLTLGFSPNHPTPTSSVPSPRYTSSLCASAHYIGLHLPHRAHRPRPSHIASTGPPHRHMHSALACARQLKTPALLQRAALACACQSAQDLLALCRSTHRAASLLSAPAQADRVGVHTPARLHPSRQCTYRSQLLPTASANARQRTNGT